MIISPGSLTLGPTAGTYAPAPWVTPVKIKERSEVISDIVQKGYWIKPTGSRVTESGWTQESDWDYVIYDPDKTLVKELQAEGAWYPGGSGDGTEFTSFKKRIMSSTSGIEVINLIIVDDEVVWKNFIVATNLIKSLNCKTKEERVKIFNQVSLKDSNSKAALF